MLLTIEAFLSGLLSGNEAKYLRDEEDVKIASAALLVHCAKADGDFSDAEEGKLRSILADRFELTAEDADTVIKTVERHEQDAVDIHRFTRVLHKNLDRDGRIKMVKLLWELAGADGTVDHNETNLVSLAAKLLHIEAPVSVALKRELRGKKSAP